MSAGRASVVGQDSDKCLGGRIQEWHVWPWACPKGWSLGNGYEIISALLQKYLLVWCFPLGEGHCMQLEGKGLRFIRNAKCLPYCRLNPWLLGRQNSLCHSRNMYLLLRTTQPLPPEKASGPCQVMFTVKCYSGEAFPFSSPTHSPTLVYSVFRSGL